MVNRSRVDKRPIRTKYRPYLTALSCPAYCAKGWIAVADNDGVDHIYYVERVDRPWQDQNGLHVTLLKDGSRRPFKPETPDTNGRNPCLLWILGEVHPWYFDSGWDNVRKITFNHRGSDD
jgi:hypothetical protein